MPGGELRCAEANYALRPQVIVSNGVNPEYKHNSSQALYPLATLAWNSSVPLGSLRSGRISVLGAGSYLFLEAGRVLLSGDTSVELETGGMLSLEAPELALTNSHISLHSGARATLSAKAGSLPAQLLASSIAGSDRGRLIVRSQLALNSSYLHFAGEGTRVQVNYWRRKGERVSSSGGEKRKVPS